jgi:uncharacterized protein (DUF305 family)
MRNHRLLFAALSLTALAALVAPALAQQEGAGQMPMQGGQMMQQTPMHGADGLMPMARPPATPKSKADAALQAASVKMHRAMAIEYTGDADVDFVRSMIPHHQGAIDMAEVELKHGTDPEMRKMAQDIIAAQEKEIATMKGWLAAHDR